MQPDGDKFDARVYVIVLATAFAIIVALWAFTAAFNIPLEGAP